MRDRRAGERRGRSKALLPQDSMVLTLTILRTDMTFAIAASLFGVSPETASRHFTTWLSFLDTALSALFPYPSTTELRSTTYPKYKQAFRMEKLHFESFIDCHEQQCETPTNKTMHSVFWYVITGSVWLWLVRVGGMGLVL